MSEVKTNKITSLASNNDITLAPDGTGAIKIGDSTQLVFGDGSDFKISHNGSKTKLEDTGTGNLEIRGTNIEFYSGDGGETLAKLTDDGAAELYHNNTKRIETTSTGCSVTGSAVMTGTDTFNSAATGSGILLKDSGVTSRQLHIAAPGSVSEAVIGTPNSHNLTFATNNTERLRITSGGSLLVGTTSASMTGFDDARFRSHANGKTGIIVSEVFTDGEGIIIQGSSNTGNRNAIVFLNGGLGTVGSVVFSSSSTSYNTSSDHRLKENVADMTGAIDRVKALAPKRFNFIVDADTTVDGFLAHEAQAVVPEAVHGTHNEVDDDGNAVMQGIDQSKLVPLLVGALKESIAKIETLETKVAALEAGE